MSRRWHDHLLQMELGRGQMSSLDTMRVVLIGFFALLLSGCAVGRIVPGGVAVGTEGVVIEGEGFRIVEGRPSELPFVLRQTSDRRDLLNQYDEYREKHGAREVRVHVPGLQEPLYGLLSLHYLPADASGPARRSLSIRIPPRYVAAAMDGNVSVVYEPVEGSRPDCAIACRQEHTWYGWILWLSDRPF